MRERIGNWPLKQFFKWGLHWLARGQKVIELFERGLKARLVAEVNLEHAFSRTREFESDVPDDDPDAMLRLHQAPLA